MNILIIDEDNNSTRELNTQLKRLTDYRILTTTSTDQILKETEALYFDFVFINLQTPNINPTELISSLDKQGCHAPVFLIPEESNTDLLVKCLKAGAEGALDTTYDAQAIINTISTFTQTERPWEIGFLINEYRLKDFLTETCGSLIFLAEKENDEILYAVKVIKDEEMEINENAYLRFQREIDTINKMEHPNIIHIYDVGTINGSPYMIMPYIEGTTLGEAMKSMGEVEFLDVILSLLDTLWDVHKFNLIHRDLKPDNIMFSKGRPILLDFGTVLARNEMEITQHNSIIGTPNYIAPEAFISGRKVDYRADIYSLGIILYEYVYKKCPYDGEDFRAIYTNLKTLNEEDIFHGSQYDHLLKELINKDPNKRHDSVLTIAEELTKIKISLTK